MSISANIQTLQNGDILIFNKPKVNNISNQLKSLCIAGNNRDIKYILSNDDLSDIFPNISIVPYDNLNSVIDQYYNNIYQNQHKIKYYIGVTGSYGKSSVCYFLHQLLNQISHNMSCLISSIGTGTNTLSQAAHLTTPDYGSILDTFYANKDNSDFGILEVSSHAVEYNRIGNIKFDISVFTSYSPDNHHFHIQQGDKYLKYKQDFFTKGKIKIGNNIPFPEYIQCQYSYDDIYFYIDQYKIPYNIINNQYLPKIHKENIGMSLYILYNIYKLGYLNKYFDNICISFQDIIDKININNIQLPSGRSVHLCTDNYNIIIDGAHSANTIKSLLESLNKSTIFMFGVLNDYNKYPFILDIFNIINNHHMVEELVITTDGSFGVIDEKLLYELSDKLHKSIVIYDRFQAIEYSINKSNSHNNIVIAGKSTEAKIQIKYPGYIIFYEEEEIVKYFVNKKYY